MIPDYSIIDRLTDNPELVFILHYNDDKVLYRNVDNKIDINVKPLNTITTDINVDNININNNMINNIIKNCDKLDSNIKYSNNIKNIGIYLSDLVSLFRSETQGNVIINDTFINECLDLFSHYDKNISVNVYCDRNYKINYNPLIIKQVLVNLISNAYKYNYKYGNIIIKVCEYNQQVHLTVHNTGCGLHDNYINIGNLKYYNVDSNRLGLNNCIYLLDNPTINIESCKNKYFNITISFNM